MVTLVNTRTVPRPQRITVHVADDSDKGGLTKGQTIRVKGYIGLWTVVYVHPPAPPIPGKVAPRTYDLQQLPGNRAERRRANKAKK